MASIIRRHLIVTLVVTLTCTHGVIFGLILGAVEVLALPEGESSTAAFTSGFLQGVLIEAVLASAFMFFHRKEFR